VDIQIQIFLTSALVEGEWSASRPSRFTPGESNPRFPFDKLGGPQSWTEQHGPYRDSNFDPLVVQPVASRCTDCAHPAPHSVRLLVNNELKVFGRKRSRPNSRYHPRIDLGELRGATILIQNSRCLDQDSKRTPPE
jgi:hypothetical protein